MIEILRASSPAGRDGGRASAALALLDDVPHRLRRAALHLPRPALAPKCEPIFAQALNGNYMVLSNKLGCKMQ
jgi:hypothetical protein